MIDQNKIEALLDWLIDGAPPFNNPDDIISAMCTRLNEANVPIDRFVLFIYTLHPNIKGRRFKWEPGKPVDMVRAAASVFTSDLYHHNPLPRVIETKKAVRRRIMDPGCPNDYIIITELREEGVTDYYAQPLSFMNGEINVASWSTKSSEGYDDEIIATLNKVGKPLARLTETYLSYLNAANLLSTYVGRNVGEKIMAGVVDRGSGEEIDAVILFVDLKQFTALSNKYDGKQLIEALNRSLDALVPPVGENGGEILKYLGDGFFAIFPIDPRTNAQTALQNGVIAVQKGVAALLAHHKEAREHDLNFGVRTALHIGKFYYGNIGGGAPVRLGVGGADNQYHARLDFTAIGPDVNYTARLLGAATQLGVDHVLSREAKEMLNCKCKSAGTADFKGFSGVQTVYQTPH